MFKTIIKWIIQALDTIVKEMQRAYDETYGLSDLSKEFTAKVTEIREKNKQIFIKAAETFELKEGLFSLEFPSYKEIQKRAKQRWLKALEKGDVDELYNLKKGVKNDGEK